MVYTFIMRWFAIPEITLLRKFNYFFSFLFYWAPRGTTTYDLWRNGETKCVSTGIALRVIMSLALSLLCANVLVKVGFIA